MHTSYPEPTTNPVVKDRFGVRFTQGQVVTYPVRSGSNLVVVTAVVIEVFVDCLKVRPLYDTYGKKRQALTNVDVLARVTALPHVQARETITGKYEITTNLLS